MFGRDDGRLTRDVFNILPRTDRSCTAHDLPKTTHPRSPQASCGGPAPLQLTAHKISVPGKCVQSKKSQFGANSLLVTFPAQNRTPTRLAAAPAPNADMPPTPNLAQFILLDFTTGASVTSAHQMPSARDLPSPPMPQRRHVCPTCQKAFHRADHLKACVRLQFLPPPSLTQILLPESSK